MATNKVQELQQEILKLTKAIKENGQATQRQANDLERLKKQYAELGGKIMPQYRKAHDEVTDSLNEAEKITSKLGKTKKGFFSRLTTATGTLFRYSLAYKAINAATQLFNELVFESAKRAIRLEKALGDVAAIANLSANEVSRLKDVVFDVAGTTSLTATQVVELQKQLAKLGTSVSDIENLTRPIALLSQALGEDAGGVAAALKKTLNQFQATTEEADRFANVLVGAVNETALSLNDLGTALQYVGPLAAQSGISFEETASLLGILADNGFRASRAGTGLRNVLLEAAKSGKPFSEFLKELSERNLDVARATEIFGKRGASAAIVLANNVDRLSELSEELSKSDRLFLANAKQMATTQGQLDLLSSAYDKFSTNLAESVTQTNFFINILAILDKQASGLAGAYKILSKEAKETKEVTDELVASFRKFSEGDDNPITESEALGRAIRLVGEEGEFSKSTIDSTYKLLLFYLKQGKDLQEAFAIASEKTGRGQLRLLTTTKELVNLLYAQSQGLDEAFISQEANNDVVKRYNTEYSALLALTKEGVNVDKEKQQLQAQVNADILSYSNELEQLRNKIGPLTQGEEERARILEKRIALLSEESTKIGKLAVDEETIADKKKKREKELAEQRKKDFNAELKQIQDDLDARLDSIQAITDTELAGAKSAEEAAQIRLKQEKLIQAEYTNSLGLVQDLTNAYPEFADQIASATDRYEKFTQFTQSAIGKEGVQIIQDYKKEFDNLGKQLSDGEISLGEYAQKEDELEASLIDSITTLKNNTEANQELKDMLDKIVVSYLNAKKSADDYVETTEETIDKVKILGKEFAKDLTFEEALGMALASASEMMSDFNDTALENTKNRLEAEKTAIANRYQTENDILKSQLDNQLITENQFRAKQKQLQKAKIAEENEIDRKIFDAEKKRDKQNATSDYLQALASIIPNLIVKDKEGNPIALSLKAALSGALATAAYGAELAAISKRKFFPKKFAEGGMVNGPSHEQGGVPFSVQGRGGYEMEGGEFIINKRATAMHRDLLERINNSGRTAALTGNYKFAQGGLVSSTANESVDYLKAIAEATTSTAIGVSKPVRAYVSSSDLRSNETERRIRDRNDKV